MTREQSHDEALRRARRRVLLSYGHKLGILAMAVLGFSLLWFLGQAKQTFESSGRKEWVVNKALLGQLYQPPTGSDTDAIMGRLRSLDLPRDLKFDSRDQMVSAVQQLAEAQVWSEYRLRVAGHLARMRALTSELSAGTHKKSSQDSIEAKQEEYTRYSDLVTKEEAYARAQVEGVRRQVDAAIAQIDPKPLAHEGKPDVWDRIFARVLDERTHLYVIYEVAWYVSLLIAVLSTSLLIIMLLTVLPITSGEGYWTKKVDELIAKAPSVGEAGGRAAGPKILAALLGTAALVPIAKATEPGGQGHPVVERRIIQKETFVTEKTSPPAPPVEIPNYKNDLDAIGRQVADLQKRVETLPDPTSALDQLKRDVAVLDERTSHTHTAVIDIQPKAEKAAEKAEATANRLEGASTAIEKANAKIEDSVHNHGEETKGALKGVSEETTKISGTLDAVTAQAGVRDPRGFVARAFGATLYQVGPIVPRLVEGRVRTSHPLDADVLKHYTDALVAMKKVEGLDRWEFERKLREQLRVELRQTPETSRIENEIIKNELHYLLQLAAVPRW